MTLNAYPAAGRRSFLSHLITLGAALGVTVPRSAHAMDAPAGPADEPWMSRLKGKHRVLFHSHLATDGIALRWAQTYLDTQKNSYGLTDADGTVVVALNGRAIGLVFNDAIWGKYPIGETLQMPGTRNANTALVAQLIERGAIVLVCNNSLRAAGQRFLPEGQRGDAALRSTFSEEARGNLLPGVEVTPAMVVTLQQAQDRGCRYVYGGS